MSKELYTTVLQLSLLSSLSLYPSISSSSSISLLLWWLYVMSISPGICPAFNMASSCWTSSRLLALAIASCYTHIHIQKYIHYSRSMWIIVELFTKAPSEAPSEHLNKEDKYSMLSHMLYLFNVVRSKSFFNSHTLILAISWGDGPVSWGGGGGRVLWLPPPGTNVFALWWSAFFPPKAFLACSLSYHKQHNENWLMYIPCDYRSQNWPFVLFVWSPVLLIVASCESWRVCRMACVSPGFWANWTNTWWLRKREGGRSDHTQQVQVWHDSYHTLAHSCCNTHVYIYLRYFNVVMVVRGSRSL